MHLRMKFRITLSIFAEKDFDRDCVESVDCSTAILTILSHLAIFHPMEMGCLSIYLIFFNNVLWISEYKISASFVTFVSKYFTTLMLL